LEVALSHTIMMPKTKQTRRTAKSPIENPGKISFKPLKFNGKTG
jgi:hypothetical protein